MSFQENTRRKLLRLPIVAKGTSNPIRFVLDRAGILAAIHLDIRGSIAGTLSAPNPFGMASIVREVRIIASNGLELFRMSGPVYHYIFRDFLDEYVDPLVHTNARSAVTATTFDVSMIIPLALNARDIPGLLLLQHKALTVVLSVEFEADANVATGAAVTANVEPGLETFSVPYDYDEKTEPFNLAVTCIGESVAIAGAGDFPYPWLLGNSYALVAHGLGIAQAGADGWSRAVLRAQQNDIIFDMGPDQADIEFVRHHGRARQKGVIPFDLLGSSGIGAFGSGRDIIHSAAVTDMKSIITATAAGTLYTVRREIVGLA